MTSRQDQGSDKSVLLEILSEFVAIERDGIRLYDHYLREAPAELQANLRDFRFEMERHATLIGAAIGRLGGDPARMSVAAETARQRTDLLLSLDADHPAGWLQRLETILILETKDAYVWDVLRLIVAESNDAEVLEALKPPTVDVASQEGWDAPGSGHGDRIGWARTTMRDMALEAIGIRRQGRWHHLRDALM
ncbi:MAG: hypothetical protein NVS9B8_16640 [Candidatus Limnocylindrales bacterium]